MLVSVIIPVYNSENTIGQSLNSVSIALMGCSYEIICIDDGSSDGSLQILKAMSASDEKIIVISQENKGAAAARNRGLEIAKGDFIAFNDSDDEWLPNHFEILKKVFDDNPSLYCIAGNHDTEKQRLPLLKKLQEGVFLINLKNELLKNYFSPPATMFKRSVIENGIRFMQGMRYAEEGYFFYQIVHSYPCGFINKQVTKSILGKAKFGDGGLSGNLKAMQKGELSNLKFARKQLGVGFLYYRFTVLFSYIKYIRRILLTNLRHK